MINALIDNSVDTIGFKDVQAFMDSKEAIVLDTRESDEFNVSHIEGAINVGYANFDINQLSGIGASKADPVILYCSIGKRSEEIGLKLKEAGYSQVYNYFGGIFDWTNRNLPVVNNKNEEVKFVHPYNSFWGFWVNNYDKAYEPR